MDDERKSTRHQPYAGYFFGLIKITIESVSDLARLIELCCEQIEIRIE